MVGCVKRERIYLSYGSIPISAIRWRSGITSLFLSGHIHLCPFLPQKIGGSFLGPHVPYS